MDTFLFESCSYIFVTSFLSNFLRRIIVGILEQSAGVDMKTSPGCPVDSLLTETVVCQIPWLSAMFTKKKAKKNHKKCLI